MRTRIRAQQAQTRRRTPGPTRGVTVIFIFHLVCTCVLAQAEGEEQSQAQDLTLAYGHPPSHPYRHLHSHRHRRAPSIHDTAILVRRVRHLRHRLHGIRVARRDLDQQRDLLERSIAEARERLEKISPAAVLLDARGVGTVQALIEDYRHKREDLDRQLAILAVEAHQLGTERVEAVARLQAVSLSDVVVRHASSLPPVMRGALRKGAAVLTPVFHSLFIVADTNDRLVQHVGSEIDRYTHFGVTSSPFMSGMLFYCVLLIPTLTLIVLVRAVADSSAKISTSHCIVAASSYLAVTCLVFVLAATFTRDPMKVLYARHERALVASNLALAAYYIWFLCVLAAETVDSWDSRSTAQFTAALAVASHYFVFAWRRIFTDKPPQLLAFNYLIYATIFGFIAYERCMRINPRWITESTVFKYIRSIDSPTTYASVMAVLNLNHLRNLQRHITNFCTRISDSVLVALQRIRRAPRRRRRNRSSRERFDSPPSPVRATATTGKGVVGLSLSRARRCALYTRVADVSDASSLSGSSSDTDPDEPAAEPLLSRTSARAAAAAKAGARALLASRSRSRSGSGGNDSPDEVRGGWWWSRRATDNDRYDSPRQGPNRGRGTASRARPHRSNGRPRKEREQHNSGISQSPFSLWKWP